MKSEHSVPLAGLSVEDNHCRMCGAPYNDKGSCPGIIDQEHLERSLKYIRQVVCAPIVTEAMQVETIKILAHVSEWSKQLEAERDRLAEYQLEVPE